MHSKNASIHPHGFFADPLKNFKRILGARKYTCLYCHHTHIAYKSEMAQSSHEAIFTMLPRKKAVKKPLADIRYFNEVRKPRHIKMPLMGNRIVKTYSSLQSQIARGLRTMANRGYDANDIDLLEERIENFGLDPQLTPAENFSELVNGWRNEVLCYG